MVSVNVSKDKGRTNAQGAPIKYCEGTCLSTDPKPTDWDNGSTLVEMDTSKVLFWDLENKVWREFS